MADGDLYLTATVAADVPTVDLIPPADRAWRLLQHLRIDPTSDWLLAVFLVAWTAGLRRIAQVAYGDEQLRPWQALTDPATAPLWALPYAAQFIGGEMPARLQGESDAAYLQRARDEVLHPRGPRRGSRFALAVAIRPYLTGSQWIRIVEFHEDSAWRILVVVRGAECADVDAVAAAANSPDLIGAGQRVTVVASDAPVWDETTDLTWDEATLTWDEADNRSNWESLP